MTDTNIDYIWHFLAECHERGWLYVGHRPMVWCPRCGTSLSQHELIDSYRDITHPSLYVRFPLHGRERRGGRRLDDDAVDAAGERARPSSIRLPSTRRTRPRPGSTGSPTARVETVFGAGAEIEQNAAGFDPRRASLRDAVLRPARPGRDGPHGADPGGGRGQSGGGHRHRPHRCRVRRRGLRARQARGTAGRSSRSTRPGVFVDGFGWLHGIRHRRRAPPGRRRSRGSAACLVRGGDDPPPLSRPAGAARPS